MKDTAKVNAGKKKPVAGQTGKSTPQTSPAAAKKSTPKPDRKKPSKASPKDKPVKPASATKSSPAKKTGTPPKKTTAKTGTKAPSAKAKETSKPVKSSTKPASRTASNKASVAKAPVAKVPAAKVAAAKTTAAKAATAKTSATKAAGAKAPVAKVPAAKVPAAKVPAAKVPAARVPFACYKGTRPYIFVSYSHKDMTEVFSTIKKLSESRYRLWYDEGIEPGFEWPEVVGKALTRCSQLIVFMSRTAAVSRNVRNEINLAFSEGKGILVVYLEKTKLTEGMKLQIGTVQFLNKYEMNAKEFVEKLKSVLSNDLHN